jgi:hypothetical protein
LVHPGKPQSWLALSTIPPTPHPPDRQLDNTRRDFERQKLESIAMRERSGTGTGKSSKNVARV